MKETPLTDFQNLGLDPLLLKALESEGYTIPTPIQQQAIPVVLEGRDLLGIAQTGTGKTAAFALPILHRLAADRKPAPRRGARALVLSPTRELANQIADSFRTYGRHMGFHVTAIFGGVGYRPQIQALQRGIDVLVATPGRLMDHLDEGNLNLDSTEVFVLDEADQMLDLGFIVPLRKIIAKLPQRRQSMFFSATMPHEIGALASELLKSPAKVSVAPAAKTADRVAQKVIFVESGKKRSLLVELFGDASLSRTLVFTRTKRGADKVAKHLEGAGIAVAAIHGNKSQGQREYALAAFKNSKIRALIATDIAARGIDVDLVSHVINFELPNVPESYVHRIGRTARAGAEGIAISFCDGEERSYLKEIERLTRQTIPSEDRRGDASLIAPPAEPKGQSSGGGDRGRNGRPGERRTEGRRNDERRGEGHRGDPRRRAEPRRDEHRRDEQRPDDRRAQSTEGRGGERRTWEPRGAEHRSTEARGASHRDAGHRGGPRNAGKPYPPKDAPRSHDGARKPHKPAHQPDGHASTHSSSPGASRGAGHGAGTAAGRPHAGHRSHSASRPSAHQRPSHGSSHGAANGASGERPGMQSLSQYRRDKRSDDRPNRHGEHSGQARTDGAGFMKPARGGHIGGERRGDRREGRPSGERNRQGRGRD